MEKNDETNINKLCNAERNLEDAMALAESPRHEFVARGLEKLKNTK